MTRAFVTGVDVVRKKLNEVGFPIGWSPAPQFSTPTASMEPYGTCGAWLQMIFGWLITAVATMLGAPFWFDMLNKFMVIRSTVKPQEKSGDEGSEDRRATPPAAAPPPPAPPGAAPPPPGPPGAPPPAPPAPGGYVANQWNTPGEEQEGLL